MAMILLKPGTATGSALLLVVPLPSWPKVLSPHAQTFPLLDNARLWSAPPAMATILLKPNTWTGMGLPLVVPLPSWPKVLSPQAQRVPSACCAKLCA